MKEKDLFEAIKNNTPVTVPFYQDENDKIIVKLEGYIHGKQADLTRKLLELDEDIAEYRTTYEKLKEMESANKIYYDLSPSIMLTT